MSEAGQTDEQLVAAAQKAMSGDVRAFDQLIRRHQEKVFTNCRYLSGSADDAQDLAQEVFIKAYFSLARFESRSSFGTWIQRIKVNHCLNFLRRKKGKTLVDVQDTSIANEPELRVDPAAGERLISEQEQKSIKAALDQMPDTLRVALIMRDMDGFSYQEIADDLGIGLSAAKMRIKRSREAFREIYKSSADR